MGGPPDSSGLEQVLLANRARLLRFIAVRGGGDAAEDLLHDLWARIRAMPAQPVAEPLSYLYRAAENLMRDRYRADISRERREAEWQGDDPVDDRPSGERVLLAREKLRKAESALAALGERADRVFRRFRLDGESQAAIARELGVSLSTVEKDLQRAYRALAALGGEDDAG
jgi:RNA polymerase sigma factor (sigma-70 family)